MLNNFTVMGRLVADPELRYTPANIPVTSFRIACDRNFKNADGEADTDFFNVTAWRTKAEFISKYFIKGQMICVEGPIQQRQYEDREGNKRTAFEVVAEQAHFCGGKKENGNAEQLADGDFTPDFGGGNTFTSLDVVEDDFPPITL